MRRLLSAVLPAVLALLILPAPTAAAGEEPTRSLTDAELLGTLDLDRPELAAVRSASEAGDVPAALAALAEHFRGRVEPACPDHPILNRIATPDDPERLLAGGRYAVGTWHDFPDGEVDWLYNATAGRGDGVSFTREWTWQMNRLNHWNVWAAAFRTTRDARLPAAWAADLRHWRAQVPVEDARKGETRNAWRTIEAGIRLRSTPATFFAFRSELTDAAIIEYLHLVRDHADFLQARSGVGRTPGNWEAIEMTGLYLASVLFPEFRASGAWGARAVDTFGLIAEASFYPDGSQKELTFGYGAATAGDYLFPVTLSDELGVPTAFDRRAYLARIAPAYDWIALCTGPDGWAPWFNDKELHSPFRLRQALELSPERRDWLHVATAGAEGEAPQRLDATFPRAGMHAMRSGFTPEDHLLVFRNGPLGQSHQHQDKLSVVLWSFGQRILYDNGGGPYQDSRWRDWGIDGYSHNTVVVDGLTQRRSPKDPLKKFSREPIDSGWAQRDGSTYAQGVYEDEWGDGPAVEFSRAFANTTPGLTRPVVHRRRVLHVKPDLFVVADEVESADGRPHAAEARWHLLATEAEAGDWPGLVTQNAGASNLQLVQLSPQATATTADSGVTGGHSRDLLGWSFRPREEQGRGVEPVVPALTVRHLAEEPADRVVFLTVLAPVRAGGGPAVVSAGPADAAGAWDLRMADGRGFRLVHEAGGELSATPLPATPLPAGDR